MKKTMSTPKILLLLLFAYEVSLLHGQNGITYLKPQFQHRDSLVNGIKYESGNWKPDPYGQPLVSNGNHRFVVITDDSEKTVWAHVPWRRSDPNPHEKDVVIIDAKSGQPIHNKIVTNINNESGDIIFQPNPNSNMYYLYYLPYKTTGGHYPEVSYLAPKNLAEKQWYDSYSALKFNK